MAVSISQLTYGQAITRICRLVGHPAFPADPVGSTDPAIQQMGEAINVALNELLTMHEWQDLSVKTSLSIVADFAGQVEKAFALPADFYRFIDQTQWSEQTRLPAPGPVSKQAWMLYTVRDYTPQMFLFWQIRQDQLYILNPPTVAVDFEYMYLSNAQVLDSDTANLYKNQADKNGDTFLLDSYMIMQLGRARYLEWKGFDASAATRDFLAIFNSRAGAEEGAPVLSLNQRPGIPLLQPYVNTPDSGFGL